jgi:hypothetical protein
MRGRIKRETNEGIVWEVPKKWPSLRDIMRTECVVDKVIPIVGVGNIDAIMKLELDPPEKK